MTNYIGVRLCSLHILVPLEFASHALPVKQFVLERLLGKHRFSGEQQNLFEISLRMASSLVNVFEGKAFMMGTMF
jgi:hypothetical protein